MLVNGRPASVVSALDRGLAYGDGVFETVRLLQGRPLFLPAHLRRLTTGAGRLGIDVADLPYLIERDIAHLSGGLSGDHIIKVILTRGEGERGYQVPRVQRPTRIVSLADYHGSAAATIAGIRLFGCQTRLGRNPRLAGIKHLNRLEQVLASMEVPAGWDEGLMRDVEGDVIEGIRSNLFLIRDGQVMTPRLDTSGVAGIMREHLLGFGEVQQCTVTMSALVAATEMFVCNSVFGIHPVIELAVDTVNRRFDIGPVTRRFQQRLEAEIGRL
jgi:4-amino-4-deoxychorismate lyase